MRVKQGDLRRQRVQNGGLTNRFVVTQTFLRVAQYKSLALAVGYGVDFAGGQMFQSLLGGMQRGDQSRNFVSRV